MKKDLQIFSNKEFGEIRGVEIDGEGWFVGKDVAEALGYKDTSDSLKKHVDADEKMTLQIADSLGRLQDTYIINESGFYSLVLCSKLPGSKKFKKWVTSEVLPTIRKTGGYVANEDMFINTYLPFADEQTKSLFRSTLEVVKQQNEVIQIMQPKANYFDDLVDRNLLTNIRDTAKELKIKQNDFTKWLEEKKYIYRDSKNKIKPYSDYTPSLFELKEFVTKGGYTDTQTLITPRGRETFRLLLKKEVA